ncbi:protein vein-like isoform X1 [Rhopalosiphum padi]|uniref:protein vein-like isoform X1 n=1 Tax=Rhopalosiphum padi TaxID=40932 RepID=UPI00298E197E|nr:protein vein-like isoform X1 [Rhopalosiphum padi]XP_060853942.1 protein vein-like isoform X1 [Rhopalosiphum padi]
MTTDAICTKKWAGGGDTRDMSNGGDGAAGAVCACRRRRCRTESLSSSSSFSLPSPSVLAVWTTAFVLAAIVGAGGGVEALHTATAISTAGGAAAAAAAAAAGRMAPCAHLGDETNDVSARAYASDVVFEGKVRSKGPIRPGDGTYGVTFVVQRVHKDAMQAVTYEGLRVGSPVRLNFREKRGDRDPPQRRPPLQRRADAQCVQRFAPAAGGQTVEANIKRGAKYLVFVAGVGPHNLSVLGEPVLRTPKNVDAVQKVLCRDCVQPIGVWGLHNTTLKVKSALKLMCRAKGNPMPALQWFKDGVPILVGRRRIQYKKKRSMLVIPKVRPEDGGKYECRGTGVQTGHVAITSAQVIVNSKPDNTTALWPLVGGPCPADLVYCLNGGTCTFYETIGELVCQCAEGFKGQRCENKDIVNKSTNDQPLHYVLFSLFTPFSEVAGE